MDFLHVAIALLASMVLVLAGMVGWLYWHQQRIFQNQNNMGMVIGELARAITSREEEPEAQPEPEAEVEPVEVTLPEPEEAVEVPTTKEEDDRVSVEEGPEVVDTLLDTDGLENKTKKDLQELLSKRGIPFGKNDNKGILISLLKATS